MGNFYVREEEKDIEGMKRRARKDEEGRVSDHRVYLV